MVTTKLRRSVPILFNALFGATALAAVGTLVVGCENPAAQADKTVHQQVETAQAKDNKPEDRNVLIAALDAAAKVPNASAATKAEVKLEEARQLTDAADEAARKSGSDEIELARLAGQVQALTAQIAANNLLIQGLRDREPGKPHGSDPDPVKDVDGAIAAAKGNGDTATWGSPDKGVPANSAVEAETAKFRADIEKLTAERTKLDAQQKQNTDDARKLEDQAARAHGSEAGMSGSRPPACAAMPATPVPGSSKSIVPSPVCRTS